MDSGTSGCKSPYHIVFVSFVLKFPAYLAIYRFQQ